MKKILLSIIVVGLLGVNSMADDTITVTSEVLPAAVVGFVDVSGETLNANDRFLDATIDLGTTEVNTAFTSITKDFYVKSNNPNGVQISITPHAGENTLGSLTDIVSSDTLAVTYFIGFPNQYNMNTSPTVTLTTVATDGASGVKTFYAIPSTPINQTAGIYGTVLDVTITTP